MFFSLLLGLKPWGGGLPTEGAEDLWFLLELHFVVVSLQTRTKQSVFGQEEQAADGNESHTPGY